MTTLLTEAAVIAPTTRSRWRLGVAVACWAATLPAVAWLAVAHGLPQSLTNTSEPYATAVVVAFFGQVFTFHLGVLLAAVAVVSLALGRWRLLAVAGVAAAFALWPTAAAWLPRSPPPPSVGRPCRVWSMNVKWVKGGLSTAVVGQVRAADPDVIALQDYTQDVRRAIAAAFGRTHPYQRAAWNNGQGLAVFSRLPFDGPPAVVIDRFRRHLRVVVRLDGRPVALYVVHPMSPRSKSHILFNRLAVADLAAQVAAETVPVIVIGDCNFPPGTPNQAALEAAGMCDGFELSGTGRGSTWPARPRWLGLLPGVRIDHCFVSAATMTCTRFAVGSFDGSDHLPIVADVGFAKAAGF